MPNRKKSSPRSKSSDCDLGATSSPGMPRLDPRHRLLSRFYEPLILLYTLGQTRGERVSESRDASLENLSDERLRQLFLNHLAYSCDYEKGGDTVTAVALESRPQGPRYWISANKGPGEKVKHFVEGLLQVLGELARNPDDITERDLYSVARDCISFGHHRIKDYWSLLRPQRRRCLRTLSNTDSHRKLQRWLERIPFNPENVFQICKWAHEARQTGQMHVLRAHKDQALSDDSVHASPFQLTRHYIGRLGYHFQVAATCIAAAQRLPQLFKGFEVCCLKAAPSSHNLPVADVRQTFDSVVLRMLPSGSTEDVRRYQNNLVIMDRKFNLYSRFLASYEEKNFRPRVHCELALLEHFYANNLESFERDKFIGCSKPACYCCALYLQNHPGGFAKPASHQKIYLNWCPPDSVFKDPENSRTHQHDILNKMISLLRTEALRQISDCSGPTRWHPDSTTGITNSSGRLVDGERSSKVEKTQPEKKNKGKEKEPRPLVDSERNEKKNGKKAQRPFVDGERSSRVERTQTKIKKEGKENSQCPLVDRQRSLKVEGTQPKKEKKGKETAQRPFVSRERSLKAEKAQPEGTNKGKKKKKKKKKGKKKAQRPLVAGQRSLKAEGTQLQKKKKGKEAAQRPLMDGERSLKVEKAQLKKKKKETENGEIFEIRGDKTKEKQEREKEGPVSISRQAEVFESREGKTKEESGRDRTASIGEWGEAFDRTEGAAKDICGP
ncbi:hypothetical protein HDK90DRAFT_523243 [Phyllosticta capitalensis]|uniref:Uncharacterized protein n=1 Tax=Phyllosticta capitalensis TaxID=121624 RepID=A0ABR1YVC6_9PEZI